MAKRVLISHKDLQIKFLMDGVDAVKETYAGGNVSRATIRRTMKNLENAGKDISGLEAWYIQDFGGLGRGRGTPVVGESRSYKVQQIRRSGPFLRLPLDSLGVAKGAVVKVNFVDGEINLSAL